MKRTKQRGTIVRHRGWWVLRYREKVGVGGILRTVNRAKRLAPIDSRHKTRASLRQLASDVLEPLNRYSVSPFCVTTVGDFVSRIYLPFVEQQKRPSTARGYRHVWSKYLKLRCEHAWMREVKTHDVQQWLNDIASEVRKSGENEYRLSKTTISHVKNFMSGVFRFAAQQGFFDDGKNPVKLAEIPAFAPSGQEGRAYSLEEIVQMIRILPEPASTVVATAAFSGLRLGELRGARWEDYESSGESDSLGMLHVNRSIWRGHIGEPKTKASKKAVPVIPMLAERLEKHRKAVGNPVNGPIFANSLGKPSDLDALYRRRMKDVLTRAGIRWEGWHCFRRGLASNLNRLHVDDSVVQSILRHSDVSLTQRCYIKTTSSDAEEAMKQFSVEVSEVEKRSNCSPLCSPDETTQTVVTIQ